MEIFGFWAKDLVHLFQRTKLVKTWNRTSPRVTYGLKTKTPLIGCNGQVPLVYFSSAETYKVKMESQRQEKYPLVS